MCRLLIRRSSPAFSDVIRPVSVHRMMRVVGTGAESSGQEFRPGVQAGIQAGIQIMAHQASRICLMLKRMPPKDGEIWIRSKRSSKAGEILRCRQNCCAARAIRWRCCAVGMPPAPEPASELAPEPAPEPASERWRNFTSTKMIRLPRLATRLISPAEPRQRRARIR